MTGHIVDLSQPVADGMAVYPGDPAVAVRTAATVADDGVMVSALSLGTHTGTHVDAPRHSVEGGAPVDEVPLERLHGVARIVVVAAVVAGQRIRLADVIPQLDGPGAGIVLFRTDWSRHFGTPEALRHPFLDAEIAEHLLAAGVTTVGVDTVSPDPVAPELPFHAAFLGAGGVIVENLTNLAAVTWPEPVVSLLPLRLAGLDGSPVRAVAHPSYVTSRTSPSRPSGSRKNVL